MRPRLGLRRRRPAVEAAALRCSFCRPFLPWQRGRDLRHCGLVNWSWEGGQLTLFARADAILLGRQRLSALRGAKEAWATESWQLAPAVFIPA